MLSPPAQQLCRAGGESGAQPAPPGPVAQRLKPGEGREEPRGHAHLPEPTPSSGGSSRGEAP